MDNPTSFSRSLKHTKSVKLTNDYFGLFTDETTGQSTPVVKFTWTNSNNVSVEVITYGATITSIKVPDKHGDVKDIVMGFDDLEGYLNLLNPYFGATVGRVANRINQGRMTIHGEPFKVTSNSGTHHLHGGCKGFDKVNWDYFVNGTNVIMSYLSKDREEGFPGDLITTVSFQLTDDNEFIIEFKATTTKPTCVNLTNHSYFNLAGHNEGPDELRKHVVSINANYITETDNNYMPTGKLLPVSDTVFDLRIATILGSTIDKIPATEGYNQNFCLNRGLYEQEAFVAKVEHPESGRVLEVYSNQPGVQFYTFNEIPQHPKDYEGDQESLKSLLGKKGSRYYKHGALCLETQNYPDAVNHSNFPEAVLDPGDLYYHLLVYKFSVNN